MAGVNKVLLVGRLGADPDPKTLPDGSTVVTLSIATSESWKDKATGEKREKTEWHRVVFWRKLAEIVARYLSKGSLIYVDGKLETRKWQDQNGQDRYTTEITAHNMQMLGSKGGDNAQQPHNAQQQHAAEPLQPHAAEPLQQEYPGEVPF